MKYQFIVRAEAEADIEDSFNWYEDQIAGLGHDFRFSVASSLHKIESRPFPFPKVYKILRRAIIDRFPHSIYFLVSDDKIIVTACVHHKRNPSVWKSRE